jgi:hypothetical protein
LTDEALGRHAALYRDLLDRLAKGAFDIEVLKRFPFLNDWLLQEEGSLKR